MKMRFICLSLITLIGCNLVMNDHAVMPALKVSENKRYLEYENGEPFFWLGGTSWGMSEWLSREDIDLYLDNRMEKEFNLVQICLFWGKRMEDPVNFTSNPQNAYGLKAFVELKGKPDPEYPRTFSGGTPQSPNDYWDHVEYILQAAEKRDMVVALLPVWGRRYVNATHRDFSQSLFSISQMNSYGKFLGRSFKKYANIIWVLGGDVQADAGGDYLGHYRAMAEGIIAGITGEDVKWNEDSPLWDHAMMTYHPDGSPMKNSSLWFHQDPWLDFNMIETHRHRDSIYKAVSQDYLRNDPVKPTLMGEPDYEGTRPTHPSKGIHMRRQAYHTIFAGAAGFTYGGKIDEAGNGPLWSPFKGWKDMLNMEGANSMKFLKSFCLDNDWPDWTPNNALIAQGMGEGEFQIVAVETQLTEKALLYFPETRPAKIDLSAINLTTGKLIVQWYNPSSGVYLDSNHVDVEEHHIELSPPEGWVDGVLIVKSAVAN